ncbi:hypothetical protein PVAND_012790 [Polypedilum vanderplanki]|uniref:SCP domain-containing protein n=1 Tax=Polypedilum vanderplanki TaxID=319348 RepID=A0A9J6CNM5_POLVA|nr:hypothetical protein PVAND_012790 [Polypedilum vanderplanki]
MKFLLILVFIAFSSAQTVDWCNIANCPQRSHLWCLNPYFELSEACNQNGANLATINQALQTIIVDRHNFHRNAVAGGTVTGSDGLLPRAARMASIQWSPELARVAQLNALRCAFGHDTCRRTPDFPYSGQNLAGLWTSFNETSPSFVIQEYLIEMINLWFSEHRNTRRQDITTFTTLNVNGQPIGHFTSLVNEHQTHVGCAVIHYQDSGSRFHYIVCNYAFTNIQGFRVYTDSTTAGSGCTTGRNPVYNNLCSINERIDVKNPFIGTANIADDSGIVTIGGFF